MQKREKILAAVTGSLLLVMGGKYLLEKYQGKYDLKTARVAALQSEVQDKEFQVEKGMRSAKRLTDLEARSLPSDPNRARTLYQDYLTELLDRRRLTRVVVTSDKPNNRSGVYNQLKYHVQAQGTLEQLTELLYDFYDGGHLHQIRHLSVKPLESPASALDISLTIESLAMKKADRRDALSKVEIDRLARDSVEAYSGPLLARNLFAAWSPPPVRRDPEPRRVEPVAPPFDPSKFAFVTAIVQVQSRPQAWISVRTNGEVLKLWQGDDFEIGLLKGRLALIGPGQVEIETTDGRTSVLLGQCLRDGEDIPHTAAR